MRRTPACKGEAPRRVPGTLTHSQMCAECQACARQSGYRAGLGMQVLNKITSGLWLPYGGVYTVLQSTLQTNAFVLRPAGTTLLCTCGTSLHSGESYGHFVLWKFPNIYTRSKNGGRTPHPPSAQPQQLMGVNLASSVPCPLLPIAPAVSLESRSQ